MRGAAAITVLALTVSSARANAEDPVRGEAGEAAVLDELALGATPWQSAPDLEALSALPLPAPNEATAWVERRTRLAEGAGRELLALAALPRLDALRADARLAAAEALLRSDRLEPAPASSLARLLEATPPPDLLLAHGLARAELAAREGDDAAQAELRGVAATFDPRDERARTRWCGAADRLLEPGRPGPARPFVLALCRDETPGFETGPSADVAEALLVAGQWRYRRGDGRDAREALTAVTEASDAPLSTRCDAAVWLARSEVRTGDDGAAPPLYEWILAHCEGQDEVLISALFGLSRAAAEASRRAAAIAWTDQLVARYPEATPVDDAVVYLAEMFAELGDDDAYAATIERLLTLPHDGDWWREGVWRAARARLDSDPTGAASLLERAVAAFEWDATYYSQGRFEVVLAGLYARAGRLAEAEASWRAALTRYPLTFYARQACDALERAGLACAWPRRAGPIEPIVWPLGECLAAGERWHLLARAGLLREAAAALGAPAHDCDEARWIRAVFLERSGDYAASHDLARRDITGWQAHVGGPEADRRWALGYPRPFLELAVEEAARTGLDVALVYAIMREESGFRAEVHSYAGAQGLMQLMPATARGHAEGVAGEVTVARLGDPATNIRIGANFLAHLARHLDAEPILMVAGYNAGRGAVSRWLSARPFDDTVLWVEAIGPRQTRDYTKRVMGSLEVYRYLYE